LLRLRSDTKAGTSIAAERTLCLCSHFTSKDRLYNVVVRLFRQKRAVRDGKRRKSERYTFDKTDAIITQESQKRSQDVAFSKEDVQRAFDYCPVSLPEPAREPSPSRSPRKTSNERRLACHCLHPNLHPQKTSVSVSQIRNATKQLPYLITLL